MMKPLALLLHEKPVPGTQLRNKLEGLEYRVATVSDPRDLVTTATREMPMVVVADLTNRQGDVLAAVAAMRVNEATSHVPVIAYGPREDGQQRETALAAGVKVMATEATIVPHLAQFLEHALQLE
ncbi:MAG: hypothetical protein KF833_20480 [Verrucomicrobiae bacterium]|nr:hypothetical protein [Verrucomicrobiae bacterium]